MSDHIKCTSDYTLFRLGEGNRRVDNNAVKKLMESIKRNDLTRDYPILVTKNMTIFDGQHRFEACKRLGKPIYYRTMTTNNDDAMVDVNYNVKKWSLDDFLAHFAARGNVACQYVIEDAEKYGFGPAFFMRAVLAKRVAGFARQSFSEGLIAFQYTKSDRQRVAVFMEDLALFKPYTFHKASAFIMAFRMLWKCPQYDHERMIYQFNNYRDKLYKRTSREGYLESLLELYNYKRGKGDKLKLETDRTEDDDAL